jgi:Asp-tRNA(Asn)/Glu-tRNA(Gln) amidotransferase A subunit family amidase
MAVLGNGTDTGNSIRMPAATSALVGVYPTRGLVSIAGIAPLDWLLDNTGPIARTCGRGDRARGHGRPGPARPADGRDAPALAQRPPYGAAASEGATLMGRRFGVPAFVLAGPTGGLPRHSGRVQDGRGREASQGRRTRRCSPRRARCS